MRSRSTGPISSAPRSGRTRSPNCPAKVCPPRHCARSTFRESNRPGCRHRRRSKRTTLSFLDRPTLPRPSWRRHPVRRRLRVRNDHQLPLRRCRQRQPRAARDVAASVGRRLSRSSQLLRWSEALVCINTEVRAEGMRSQATMQLRRQPCRHPPRVPMIKRPPRHSRQPARMTTRWPPRRPRRRPRPTPTRRPAALRIPQQSETPPQPTGKTSW